MWDREIEHNDEVWYNLLFKKIKSMNVCVDVYFINCWLLMLTNEYEYNDFGKKAFYEKLKCLLTDVISF